MIEEKTFAQKVIEFNKTLSQISMELPDGFTLSENGIYIYTFNKDKANIQNNKEIDKKIKIKVKNIVKAILKVEPSDEDSIKDKLDSLMFIRLVVTIEKEFEIEIDLSKINIQDFDTIEKICKFVEVNKNEN